MKDALLSGEKAKQALKEDGFHRSVSRGFLCIEHTNEMTGTESSQGKDTMLAHKVSMRASIAFLDLINPLPWMPLSQCHFKTDAFPFLLDGSHKASTEKRSRRTTGDGNSMHHDAPPPPVQQSDASEYLAPGIDMDVLTALFDRSDGRYARYTTSVDSMMALLESKKNKSGSLGHTSASMPDLP